AERDHGSGAVGTAGGPVPAEHAAGRRADRAGPAVRRRSRRGEPRRMSLMDAPAATRGAMPFTDTLREFAGRFATGALVVAMLLLVGLPVGFVLLSAVLRDPFSVISGFTPDKLVEVYTSSAIWYAAWQTVAMSLAVGVLSTVIGGFLAWTLTRFRL